MNILEKQKAIQELQNEQLLYLKKSLSIAKLQEAKRASTAINRAFKVVSYAMKVRELEIQKNIIASTPILDGCISGGTAIIGEFGKELA